MVLHRPVETARFSVNYRSRLDWELAVAFRGLVNAGAFPVPIGLVVMDDVSRCTTLRELRALQEFSANGTMTGGCVRLA